MQMKGELDAVIRWVENLVRHELIVKRLKLIRNQVVTAVQPIIWWA